MTDVTPLDRVSAALAALSDAELDDAIRALGEGEHFAALAQALNTKRPALLAHPNPSEVVRPRSFSGTPGRRVLSAMALCGPCADDCIDNLGDAADDPSRADMEGVLDGLLERWGTKIVTLMLAAYPAVDAPCGPVFIDLLDTDSRFALGADTYEEAKRLVASQRSATDGPVLDDKGLDRARRERDARIAQEAAKRRKKRK